MAPSPLIHISILSLWLYGFIMDFIICTFGISILPSWLLSVMVFIISTFSISNIQFYRLQLTGNQHDLSIGNQLDLSIRNQHDLYILI